jgi:hypothetical protein
VAKSKNARRSASGRGHTLKPPHPKIPRRYYYADVGPFPILYVRLVRAAEAGGEQSHAGAMSAFGSLALVQVPRDGVLPSRSTIDGDETYQRIHDIAARYLGLAEAEERLSKVIASIPAEQRDALLPLLNEVRSIRDTAYHLYGLSLGIVLSQLGAGTGR